MLDRPARRATVIPVATGSLRGFRAAWNVLGGDRGVGHTIVNHRAVVIGAGICGMQVALDTADSGYEVIHVEMEPPIEGHRAQVSETFPTPDCSQCTLTPRTVEVGQHPNTEQLTLSEVVGVEELSGGQDEDPGAGPGTGLARNHGDGFHVGIKKHPRHVDEDRCAACGDCAEARLVVVPNEFDRGLAAHRAHRSENHAPLRPEGAKGDCIHSVRRVPKS